MKAPIFRLLPFPLGKLLSISACLAVLGLPRRAGAAQDDWWAQDKALHFLVSATLSGAVYSAGAIDGQSRATCAGLGLGAAILVGAGKEGWDAMGHGDPSWKDFTWDVAGALVGVGLSLLVDAAARPATTTY